MTPRLLFLIGGLLAAASGMAQPNPTAAQTEPALRANICSDEWITYAIWDVSGRTRNPKGKGESGECDPRLYGGSWKSYAQLRTAVAARLSGAGFLPNPAEQEIELARKSNYCEDPWITLAIRRTQSGGRNPNGLGTFAECNPKLYRGGEWANYGQLVEAVRATLGSLASQGVRFLLRDNGNNSVTIQTLAGQAVERCVVTGKLLGNRYAPDGANAAAQGMGDIVVLEGITFITNDSGDDPKSKFRLPNGEWMIVRR